MTTRIQNLEPKTSTEKSKPVKIGSVVTKRDRADLPEFIKGDELESHRPFTIFGASESKGRYGDRIRFDVAYKDAGETVKKVLTLSRNEERTELMYQVRKNKALINCRIVKLFLGGGTTYWKIIDNDEPVPEEAELRAVDVSDEDIPF